MHSTYITHIFRTIREWSMYQYALCWSSHCEIQMFCFVVFFMTLLVYQLNLQLPPAGLAPFSRGITS